MPIFPLFGIVSGADEIIIPEEGFATEDVVGEHQEGYEKVAQIPSFLRKVWRHC